MKSSVILASSALFVSFSKVLCFVGLLVAFRFGCRQHISLLWLRIRMILVIFGYIIIVEVDLNRFEPILDKGQLELGSYPYCPIRVKSFDGIVCRGEFEQCQLAIVSRSGFEGS